MILLGHLFTVVFLLMDQKIGLLYRKKDHGPSATVDDHFDKDLAILL
jgi:hypothetical protein